MSSGIYCIENRLNGKQYFGQGFDVEKRMWESHKGCNIIYDAIKKYGKEKFNRWVLIYCEEWELTRLEIACIKIFHSHVSGGGYNISWGGDAPMEGRNHSGETKELMSKQRSGENHPLYGKRGKESPNYGKHPSDVTRKIMSENHADFSGENHPNFGTKQNDATSQYHGVSKKIIRKKYVYWEVGLCINGKRRYIEIYKTEIEAAKAYNKYVIDNNLSRPLNFL